MEKYVGYHRIFFALAFVAFLLSMSEPSSAASNYPEMEHGDQTVIRFPMIWSADAAAQVKVKSTPGADIFVDIVLNGGTGYCAFAVSLSEGLKDHVPGSENLTTDDYATLRQTVLSSGSTFVTQPQMHKLPQYAPGVVGGPQTFRSHIKVGGPGLFTAVYAVLRPWETKVAEYYTVKVDAT